MHYDNIVFYFVSIKRKMKAFLNTHLLYRRAVYEKGDRIYRL